MPRRSLPLSVARPQSLVEAFDPRANSLAVLRLALAGVVAVTHALANGYDHQPVLGRTEVSALAVDAFFVLSGFLVTRSQVRLRSTSRFLWHRLLRLMPAFWVCLVVTAVVVAPLAAVLSGRSAVSVFTTQDPAWRYVLVNAALPIVQFPIGGLEWDGSGDAVNGALWTLQYEALCYGAVAVLGLLGVLARRREVVLLLCVAAWLGAVADATGVIPYDVPVLDNQSLFRFLLMFLLGVAGWLWADRLWLHWSLAVGSAVVVLASVALPDYRLAGAACLAYLCLYAMVRLPRHLAPRWDLSYGLYVYHWPVQFLLGLAGLASALAPLGFVLLSTVVALGVAAVSWRWVEEPALRWKDVPSPLRATARPRRGRP